MNDIAYLNFADSMIESLDEKEYPYLINYCRRNNENRLKEYKMPDIPKGQSTLNKFCYALLKIDDGLLNEIQKIEDEKFSIFKKEPNLDEKTQDIVNILTKYAEKNRILGETCGLPGTGKSHFVSKYFPNMSVSMDSEFMKFYDQFDKSERVSGMADIMIRKYVRYCITEKLKNGESMILDSVSNTKKYREDNLCEIKNYDSVMLFLFDSHCQTCYERMQNREKLSPGQVSYLSELVYFLLDFESPLNKDLTPEKGIDLILAVNTQGEIKSAYPLENYEKIKESLKE
jgi:predicted kinase